MTKRIVALAMLALLLGVNVGAQSAKPVVIASHSILADVARNVAGDLLDVRTLIPAGSDPHHFIPTPSDLAAIAEADLVLINGIGYEETLLEAIENAGANVNIRVASACIDVRPAGAHDDHDEHAHDDEDEHAHDDEDEHAHDEEDEHAHDDEDEHAHDDEDEHAHDEEDEHAHDDEDEHAHDDEDEHAHDDEDDEHAHDDEDEHAHDDEMSDCDEQDAEFYAIGFHDHGNFLGRAEDIECAAHVHGEEHDDHGEEHDDHGEEHDDHGDMHDDHGHDEGTCDPHIWFDPQNVIRWALTIRDSFSEIDPDHAGEYHEHALAYAAELDALERDFIWPALENLPEEKRLLVTAHDALGYLAGTFGFEIVSTVIPGVSTVVEPSASDVASVIDVIREHDLTAIFGESITSDKILQVIAAETGAEIASLYTDSLSDADGPAATYLDYMRYNFSTIVVALGS